MSTNLYRVWCLSCDDTEEDGKDLVTVGLSQALRSVLASTPRWRDPIEVYYALDAQRAAEEYAGWYHDSRDGYEDTWPLTFRVRCPDGSLQDFEVNRNFDPTFSASELAAEVKDEAKDEAKDAVLEGPR